MPHTPRNLHIPNMPKVLTEADVEAFVSKFKSSGELFSFGIEPSLTQR